MSLVVDGYVKGFAREPGKNAGYRAGRVVRRQCVRHITAGSCVNDRAVLISGGLSAGYVPRDPSCGPGAAQFAELDAVVFSCCEWNHVTFGALEVEAIDMGTPFTDYQIDKCGLWVAACIEQGIADRDNRVPGLGRFPLGTDIEGFVDHQDLQQRACDQHSDGWNQWPEIRAAADKYLGGGGPSFDWTLAISMAGASEEEEYAR